MKSNFLIYVKTEFLYFEYQSFLKKPSDYKHLTVIKNTFTWFIPALSKILFLKFLEQVKQIDETAIVSFNKTFSVLKLEISLDSIEKIMYRFPYLKVVIMEEEEL